MIRVIRRLFSTGFQVGGTLVCVLQWGAFADDWITLCSEQAFRRDPVEFVVPRMKFYAVANSWDPTRDELPTDLTNYVQKAKEHIASQRKVNTNEVVATQLDFGLTWLKRRNVVGRRLEVSLYECWYLRFTLKDRGPRGLGLGEPQIVVLLLDGTVATEKRANERESPP